MRGFLSSDFNIVNEGVVHFEDLSGVRMIRSDKDCSVCLTKMESFYAVII